MIDRFVSKFSRKPIKIIGSGLAGMEIALILANNGFNVYLFDNGTGRKEQALYSDKYTTFMTENMKYELECLNSPIFSLSKKYGCDKFGFDSCGDFYTLLRQKIESTPNINIFDYNIDTLSKTELTVLATGHNTDKRLINDLKHYIGELHTCFFQPEKMVIDANSIDMTKLYTQDGANYYLNFTEEEYDRIYNKIIEIDEEYELPEDFADEKQITAEGLARRGRHGLRNAIFRPRMVETESGNIKTYATLKLVYRKNFDAFIVKDFYTAFDEDEQKEILYCLDVLRNCKILQYSKIIRKTYLLAPACLNENLQLENIKNFYVCGGFAGIDGVFETLLLANYCAYDIIATQKECRGIEELRKNTCIGIILDNLLNENVVNFRLISLNYDIINKDDYSLKFLEKEIEVQKNKSKTQIEKFKEKFYGKYF